MDFNRLEETVEPELFADKLVAVVGCSASYHLITNLTRCGVRRWLLIDPDFVSSENLCRTDFAPADIGHAKVDVIARKILKLCPSAEIHCRATKVEEAVSHDTRAGASNVIGSLSPTPALIIAASDSFDCQAFVNRLALVNRYPALFVGLGDSGLGAEIAFWFDGLPCYRCLLAKRYLFRRDNPDELDPPSAGSTIFDTDLVDAIAGQLALGMLMRGTANRSGLLLHVLGDRNYLRVKIDPSHVINGQDMVRQELGISDDNEHYLGWCVSVQRDPDRGDPPCEDCLLAGHRPYHESSAVTSLPPLHSPEA